MNSLPKISIITPSYNQVKYIEQTICSVIGQNYPNLEYLIIDGGSTDGSVEIIKKYRDHIMYWVSEKDNGQSHAINKGFEKATGVILMWLNSDDLLMPNALNFIADTYLKHGDKIYFGNCIHFGENENGSLNSWGSDVIERHRTSELKEIDYIIQPSSFWTRKIWEQVGELKENMHYAFDWEWYLRAQNNGIKLHGLQKAISLYRFHSEHKTSFGGNKRQDEILSIYKVYSTRLAKLYSLLQVDDKKTITNWPLRKILSLINISDYGKRLKFWNPKKYKEFSVAEINSVHKML